MISVFVADDHPMIQTALESLLRGGRQKIVGRATSGAEAIKLIDGSSAQVLILDVQMPGGSGIHVMRELRKRGDRRPVVLLTAAISDEALREAVALQANGIVLKTSDPRLLIDCINEVSNGGTWLDEAIRDRVAEISRTADSHRTLSSRECEIVRLVQQGLKNREIASRLNITEGTVKVFLHGIFDKVGVNTRTELAAKAAQLIGEQPG